MSANIPWRELPTEETISTYSPAQLNTFNALAKLDIKPQQLPPQLYFFLVNLVARHADYRRAYSPDWNNNDWLLGKADWLQL